MILIRNCFELIIAKEIQPRMKFMTLTLVKN